MAEKKELLQKKRDLVVKNIVKVYNDIRIAPWTRNDMYARIKGCFDGYVRFATVGEPLSPEQYKIRRKELSKEILEAVNTSRDIVLNDDDRRVLKRLTK